MSIAFNESSNPIKIIFNDEAGDDINQVVFNDAVIWEGSTTIVQRTTNQNFTLQNHNYRGYYGIYGSITNNDLANTLSCAANLSNNNTSEIIFDKDSSLYHHILKIQFNNKDLKRSQGLIPESNLWHFKNSDSSNNQALFNSLKNDSGTTIKIFVKNQLLR